MRKWVFLEGSPVDAVPVALCTPDGAPSIRDLGGAAGRLSNPHSFHGVACMARRGHAHNGVGGTHL